MSDNHKAPLGGGQEKFRAYTSVVIPNALGSSNPQLLCQGKNTGNQPRGSHYTGHNSHKEVSLPTCRCKFNRHNDTCFDNIGRWLLGVLMVLSVFIVASHYSLWVKYQDLKTVQLQIQARLENCGRLESDDVIGGSEVAGDDNEGEVIELLVEPDAREELSEHQDVVEGLEEWAVFPERSSNEEPSVPNKYRYKRDDRRKQNRRPNDNRNGKSQRNKRRKGNRDTEQTNIRPASIKLEGNRERAIPIVPGSKFVDWEIDTSGKRENTYFHYGDGVVVVQKKGLYFVYGQITYTTRQPQTSFSIIRKNDQHVNGTALLTCISHMNSESTMHQTCYTARPCYLEKNDLIYVSDNYGREGANLDKLVNFQSHLSFWGLIKLI